MTIIPLLVFTRIFGRIVKQMSKKQADAYGKASAVSDEILSNIRTVLLFGREDFAMKSLDEN